MKPKHIVLLSGGMDSAVAAYWAKEKFGRGISLCIWYDQRHVKEIDFAFKLTEQLKFFWYYRCLPLSEICGESALIDLRGDVNKRLRGLPASFVPGRNLFMLTIAGVIAYQERVHDITGGWNAIDYGGYPDCRVEFLCYAQTTITKALDWEVEIHAPLILMNKKQILELGVNLKVPFELTWSCYEGGDRPCGKCNSCKNRVKGFREMKMKDPLLERRQNEST